MTSFPCITVKFIKSGSPGICQNDNINSQISTLSNYILLYTLQCNLQIMSLSFSSNWFWEQFKKPHHNLSIPVLHLSSKITCLFTVTDRLFIIWSTQNCPSPYFYYAWASNLMLHKFQRTDTLWHDKGP